MPQRLTRVQKRAFTERGNLYAPYRGALPVSKLSEGPEAVILVASDVPGRIDAKSEVAAPVRGLGSSNIDQMDTTDHLRLPEKLVDGAGNPLKPEDGWIWQRTTGSGLDDGDWYAFQGDALASHFRSQVRMYLVKQTTRPPIAEMPGPGDVIPSGEEIEI